MVDSSVVISSILGDPDGAPARIMRQVYLGEVEAFSSRAIVDELYRVLFSEKVASLLRERAEVAVLTLLLFSSSVTFVEPRKRFDLCRDQEDNKFLEAAYEARSQAVVTLDKDLLDLRNEDKSVKLNDHEVKILRPEEALRDC